MTCAWTAVLIEQLCVVIVMFNNMCGDCDVQQCMLVLVSEKANVEHKVISNDELFYDPDMDDDDQRWVDNHRRKLCVNTQQKATKQPSTSQRKRHAQPEATRLPTSDAVLNCPACMTLLCRDCQRFPKITSCLSSPVFSFLVFFFNLFY